MQPANLLFILSDEHNKRVLGCYGSPHIRTSNLDRLAVRGTRFACAYTNCPIGVPARASLATGRYVHQIRYWDNAIAYDGRVPSWGHRLMEQGHRVTSIGKLHYLDSDAKRNGFDEEILPLHIVNGVGDLLGLIRDELPGVRGRRSWGPKPVTLADGFPTFIHALGAQPDPRDQDLPGHSLFDIAQGYVSRRTILSEYHAAGAICGSFMIRHGKWKYVHYVELPPMLFDLEADPFEREDLGRDSRYGAVIRECEAALRTVVDPEAVDRLAWADQHAMIEKHGGKDAIMKRGTFRYSPPPGVKASYY